MSYNYPNPLFHYTHEQFEGFQLRKLGIDNTARTLRAWLGRLEAKAKNLPLEQSALDAYTEEMKLYDRAMKLYVIELDALGRELGSVPR